MIGGAAKELVDKITIGSMYFDTIEPGFHRQCGCASIIIDNPSDFARLERARGAALNEIGDAPIVDDVHAGIARHDRGCRNRRTSLGLDGSMRYSSDMPYLKEYTADGIMHGLGGQAPNRKSKRL